MHRPRAWIQIESISLSNRDYMKRKAKKVVQPDSPSSARQRFAEALLDNLPGMAYRCENDRGWTTLYVSDGCESLTGYRKDLFMGAGKGLAELVHPEHQSEVRHAVDAAILANQEFDIQYRIVDAFGKEKWVREQGRGTENDNGKVGSIEGYIADVTPLISASLALTNEELRQKHEHLTVTIENAPMGIVTYGPDGLCLSANRAFCRMTGYSADELAEMTMLDLTHPDDREDSIRQSAQLLKGEIDSYSQRQRYLRKDGTPVSSSVVNTVTHDASGQPNLVIGHVTDLTAQIQAQAEIRRQHDQLAHADRLNTLGEMATGIAHEINQPLTAISLFAQAGRRLLETKDYDRLHEIFDKLSLHSRRAGAIIERVQDLARQKQTSRQRVSLVDLIKDVVELAEVDARNSGIDIEVRNELALPDVEVNVVQIQQVILNLLRNGMDAMRSLDCRNGKVILISAKICDDETVVIAVTDSGCGVSSEVVEGLFSPFSTSKASGLGMGLPISNAIITEHGGKMAFSNNKTVGATFTFTLPAARKGDHHG